MNVKCLECKVTQVKLLLLCVTEKALVRVRPHMGLSQRSEKQNRRLPKQWPLCAEINTMVRNLDLTETQEQMAV